MTVDGGSTPVGDGAVGLALMRNLHVSLVPYKQVSNLPWGSGSLCSYTAAALLDSPSPPKLAMEILFEWEPLRSAEPNLFIILLRPSFSPAGRSGGGCCDILVTALGEVDHTFDHEISFFPFPRSVPVVLTVS